MKTTRFISALFAAMLLLVPCLSMADEPVYPDYVQKSQGIVEKASSQASELDKFTDEVLIARNFIRNAEAEYKKNLSWTGKLDAKAEPTVRYFSSMAQLQAEIVLSRAGRIMQEKAKASYEAQAADVNSKIKVFDDKNAEIAALKASLAAMAAKAKVDLDAGARLLTGSEQKVADLARSLEQSQADNNRLRAELAALSAAKGAEASQSQEQIKALSRQKDFTAEVGKLGGMIKAGSDNMTVVFSRSGMVKAPRYDKLTADGSRILENVTGLLKKYPEYRVRIKVHGFGTPAKNEDATATDRMARLIRSSLVEKGKLDPAGVEALGAGTSDPIYPRSNAEGNRRVEITFVRK